MTPNWQAELYTSITDIELEGDARDEDITIIRLSAVYNISRTADLMISYVNEVKDSNIASFEYDRNAIATTFTFAL